MISFRYIACNNFGDAVNDIFWEKILDTKILVNKLDKPHYVTTGSIMTLVNNNSIILGSGFISANSSIGGNTVPNNTNKIISRPKEIISVRGPKTRNKLLEFGITCPEQYGDPLIIFPVIYNKSTIIDENIVGIIPHYVDKLSNNLKTLQSSLIDNGYNVNIIDIEVRRDYANFIDNINKCKYIISSSLHGVIMGIIYKKKTIYVNFSDKVIGGDFKFDDFFESLDISYTRINDYSYNIINNTINVDYQKLISTGRNFINICPFISNTRKEELLNLYNDFYIESKALT